MMRFGGSGLGGMVPSRLPRWPSGQGDDDLPADFLRNPRGTKRCTNMGTLFRGLFLSLYPERTYGNLTSVYGTEGGLPHNQMESPKTSLNSVFGSSHSLAKTFSSPSSKELFSESEWSRLIDHLALPERQVEILDLLLRGENDKQIARKLKISQPTLRTHLQRMYGRFNVPNRTSLVVELIRLARDCEKDSFVSMSDTI